MPDNATTALEHNFTGTGKDPAMVLNRIARRMLVATAGFTLTGTVFAGGCGSDALSAVVVGLNAAAQSLNDSQDEDLSFGDWLLDELGDL